MSGLISDSTWATQWRRRDLLRRRMKMSSFTSGVCGLLAAVACAASVAGCALESTPKRTADSLPEQVFEIGYQRIADLYFRPVDLGQLTFAGLRGLSHIDESLSVERARNGFRLVHAGSVAAELPTPLANDPRAWARTLSAGIASARRNSPAIRSASAENVYLAVFEGLTGSLDEHSHYHAPERATDERAQREGHGGIGVGLRPALGGYAITHVLPQSPAALAGVRTGDRIVAVAGESAATMSSETVRDRLTGPIGTEVAVTLSREGTTRQVTLRRRKVIPNTITTELVDDIALVKIERFNAATASRVQQAIRDYRIQSGGQLRGLILDVRDNPGGLLDQAVAVADLFLQHGTIVTTRGRHPESRQRFEATPGDVLEGLPIVVIVDGMSASAAEVVAAALQDDGRAVVVGSASLGKGSVQTVTRLPNDGELLLTWSRLYAPSGYTLHNIGVLPTICTSAPNANLNMIVAGLRDGQLLSPIAYANWRSTQVDDRLAVERLATQCPREPQRRADVDIDLEVAKRLIADRPLYRRAAAVASPVVAQSNRR